MLWLPYTHICRMWLRFHTLYGLFLRVDTFFGHVKFYDIYFEFRCFYYGRDNRAIRCFIFILSIEIARNMWDATIFDKIQYLVNILFSRLLLYLNWFNFECLLVSKKCLHKNTTCFYCSFKNIPDNRYFFHATVKRVLCIQNCKSLPKALDICFRGKFRSTNKLINGHKNNNYITFVCLLSPKKASAFLYLYQNKTIM